MRFFSFFPLVFGLCSCATFLAGTDEPLSQRRESAKSLSVFAMTDSLQKREESVKPLSQATAQIKIPAPEHLTKEFWQSATAEKLKRKLKTIENPNELRPDNDQSMLHLLVRHGGEPKMIPLLVSAGVDVRLKDQRSDGSSVRALIYAAGRNWAFLEEMLKHDQQVNEPGLLFYKGGVYMVNALMLAVYRRLPAKAVRRLLALGADPNLNYQGLFALMFAVLPNEYGPIDFKTAHVLLDGGADKNLKSREGETAFDLLTDSAQKLEGKGLKSLLSRLKP